MIFIILVSAKFLIANICVKAQLMSLFFIWLHRGNVSGQDRKTWTIINLITKILLHLTLIKVTFKRKSVFCVFCAPLQEIAHHLLSWWQLITGTVYINKPRHWTKRCVCLWLKTPLIYFKTIHINNVTKLSLSQDSKLKDKIFPIGIHPVVKIWQKC